MALVLSPTIVHADTLEEVESKQESTQTEVDKLKEEKNENDAAAQEKLNRIDEINAETGQVTAELRALDDNLNAAQGELKKLEDQEKALETKIQTTEKEINTLEGRLAENKAKFRERLKVMYKNGQIGSLEVILASTNVNDYLSRSRAMKTLAGYDKELIESMRKDMKDLETKTNELNGQKSALEITRNKQTEKVAELKEQQQQKSELLAKLNIERDTATQEVAGMQSVSKEMQTSIDNKMAELEQLAAREAELRAEREPVGDSENDSYCAEKGIDSQTVAPSQSEGYLWPSTSYEITSPFGYRYHPIFGTYRLHSGVDIGADYGSPVYATASGTVTIATYDAGGGYYIHLAHDDGTASRYLHLSGFNCYVGQHVRKGAVIGYVGSTGNSTGPHLHFEFWINGTPVDPLGQY